MSQVAIGIALMLLGSGLLLQKMGVLPAENLWRWWPVLLIVAGIANVVAPGRGKGRSSGFWLLLLGTMLLLSTARVVRLHDSWPIFLVAAGASIAWKAIRPGRGSEGRHDE